MAAQVGGEDDDGVPEIHRPALAVRDPAVVQDLQQNIEHVRVGLFHLVEQNHGIGFSPHRLGELAPLVVAYVSRGRADEPGDGEFLHILGHVDPHQVVFIVEKAFGQGFCQLRLAHSGGAEKQEAADGPGGVRNARPGAEDGLGHQAHRLILAHHPFVDDFVQVQKLLPLPLHQACDGDTGPFGDDPGDLFFGNRVVD